MDQTFMRDQQPAPLRRAGRGGGGSGAAAPTTAAPSRQRFTSDLIRAIEELELRRSSRTPEELADAAWSKLQYDLPVVELAELQALVARLRESLQGKTGWPCYLLTAKALENVTAGVRHGGSFAPPEPAEGGDAELRRLLERSLSGALTGKGPGAAKQQQQQQPAAAGAASPESPKQVYQQLCAAVLLQYVGRAAALPEAQAWQLLAEYEPEDGEDAGAQQLEQQQQEQEQGLQEQQIAAAVSTAAGAPRGAGAAAPPPPRKEAVEAEVQDEDGEQYEALDPAGAAPGRSAGSRGAGGGPARGCRGQQQPYSWPALRAKLASLASHVHYSLLAHEPLWRRQPGGGGGGGAAQQLLQLLRALGVHARADQLQPVLHAYVGVLVDRLAAEPGDIDLLLQLWEALGLVGAGVQPATAAASRGPRGRRALQGEAVLALGAVAAVWQQLPGAGARGRLWRLAWDNLLPLLEQCTQQLAYSGGSGGGGGGEAAAERGEGFAHVLLVSHVVELLVLGRPSSVDAAAQLAQRGVMRNLVQLFLLHGGDQAAEPVRRALLLCSCSSQQAAAWVLAVPAVAQQLQAAAFQPGGCAEAHGALWQLVAGRQQQQQQQQLASLDGSGAGDQCEVLLAPRPCDTQHLQRQVVLLQLLAAAQRAAGRQRLLGERETRALAQLAASIKDVAGGECGGAGAGPAPAEPVAGRGGAASETDSDSGSEDGGARRRPIRAARHSSEALRRRQSKQLQPTALRLLKELLTQGGGKTD